MSETPKILFFRNNDDTNLNDEIEIYGYALDDDKYDKCYILQKLTVTTKIIT